MLKPLHHSRCRRGQAVVEFALVLPFIVVLLLIAIDFGRVFFAYIEINNAARVAAGFAGANFWSGSPPDGAAIALVAAQETNVQGQGGEGAFKVSFVCYRPASPGTPIDCVTEGPGGAGIGNQVTVTATREFNFLTPIVDSFGAFTMSASATAPILNAVQP
jgi:uncharacterized protein (UPF0333 family)